MRTFKQAALLTVVFFTDSVAYPIWVLLLANIDAFIKLLTPTNFISFIKQGTIGLFKKKKPLESVTTCFSNGAYADVKCYFLGRYMSVCVRSR